MGILHPEEGLSCEAWLEAVAAQMVANEVVSEIAGVVGCGGGSFQLTCFANRFIASTPIGSKTCFVAEPFKKFRDAFNDKSEQVFFKSFSMAYDNSLKDVSAKYDAQG